MRKNYTNLFFYFFIASVMCIFNTSCGIKHEDGYNGRMAVTDEESEGEEEGDGYDHPNEAAAFQALRTRDLATGKVPTDKMWQAIMETEQQKRIVANSLNISDVLSWTERGPNTDVVGPSNGNTRPNNGVTSGRIDAIWVDLADPTGKTVWVGADAGGVWKTTDVTLSPATWTQVNDFFGNLYISSITQDPTNTNVMYFCTGEAYYGGEDGVGVFKSIDHGVNWTLLPSTTSYIYGSRILCDAAGNVYLATRNNGLVRSTNGGTSWTDITPTGLGNRICDLEISNTGRMHVVAGISGTAQLYRYTDNPATVTTGGYTSPTVTFTSGTQRAEIGVSGNTLYAIPSSGNQVTTIWKSVDGGDNWTSLGAPPATATGGPFANGQGFYNLAVAVNPANPNECIIGGIDNAKTTNGGTTWTRISNWVGTTGQYVHADQHTSVWYDNGNKLLFGCDGGLHFSTDGGTTIRDRNVGLRLKEFYACAIHPTSGSNYFIAGAQDNGTHQLNGAGLTGSVEILGGDGGYVAIDQDEPLFQTGTYVYSNFRRSTNGGASWTSNGSSRTDGQFIDPYDYDNLNNRVYAGTSAGQYLRWENPQTGFTLTQVPFTSLNGGSVASVCVSPYTPNRVFFGTTGGTLARADNADATPTGVTLSTGSGMPGGYLNCINVGSNEQNLVATFTNYNVTNVWVSTNGGTSWTGIDGNLPNMPVYWATFHPDDNSKMFIATETGVWETTLINGASTVWTTSPSFPTVRTSMLKYRPSDRTLLAASYGRGLWSSTVPLPSGFDLGTPAAATSACPAPASMSITLPTVSNGGFSNTISFTATGAPAGTTISPIASVAPGSSTTVTLNNTNTLVPGSYTIQVTGTASGAPNVVRNLTFTINPGTGPTITTQPLPQTVCAGSNAVFTVVATGTYQWQVSTPAVPAFTNIAGETAATLTITGTTAAQSGNQYRVIVSGQCGSTTSTAVLLTVNTAPAISANPQSVTLCAGSNNTFSATATGTGITYQWQISTAAVPAFTNIPTATSSSYTVNAITAGMNGDQYRVVVTGTCPAPATSSPATLTVVTSVGVTTQPVNATACDGSATSFTVAGSGPGVIYQWQVNTGSGFVNVPAAAPYSGGTTGTLTISPVTPAMSGYQYRALLSNATCTTPGVSNTVALTVNSLPTISANPQSATICLGGGNTFSTTASGTGITYQWQVSTAAVPAFTNIPGANAATYVVSGATAVMTGNQYRVVVTGTCSASTATSTAATLTVITPVAVVTNPSNVELCSGANATFTVVGTTTQQATIYQWEISTDGGTNFTPIAGANAASYTVNAVIAAMSNNRYRVKLTNNTCTIPAVSTAATLTVRQLPTIGLSAAPLTSLLPGQTTTLTATPSPQTGGTLTTTWTYNTTPLTVTGNTYVVNVEKVGSYQTRIVETWPSTLFCSNLSQVVVIDAPVSSKLFIFPSPNDGRFTVSYYNNGGNSTSRTVTIYDSRGSRVQHKKFTVAGAYTLLSIDLRPAQGGVYYVVVGDNAGKVLADGKVLVQ